VIRAVSLITAATALAFAPGDVAAKPAAKAQGKSQVKVSSAQTFSVTPEGGFRMGNPKAKFAIVEYGSLTCPHCRHFDETAYKPLVQQYVRTGKASYEFRPFLLNGLDLAVTLVARCEGPSHFFPIADQLYATQPDWEGKVLKLPESEQQKVSAMPQDQMLQFYAKISGVFEVAGAHGIAPARAEACLRDSKAAEALAKIEKDASDQGVHGTPTIFVNGKQVPAYDWATLEPFLKDSGG
jgi:protein-disulfide isomerase